MGGVTRAAPNGGTGGGGPRAIPAQQRPSRRIKVNEGSSRRSHPRSRPGAGESALARPPARCQSVRGSWAWTRTTESRPTPSYVVVDSRRARLKARTTPTSAGPRPQRVASGWSRCTPSIRCCSSNSPTRIGARSASAAYGLRPAEETHRWALGRALPNSSADRARPFDRISSGCVSPV